MARTNDADMLEEDISRFFVDEEVPPAPVSNKHTPETAPTSPEPVALAPEDDWGDTEDLPGQLAVDVYETADKLVVKARTAGISKSDLNVTISDNILTISGILSGGEDENTTAWHIQECYWGEFSRQIALPVPVKEDEGAVKAELKDGVLTIMFDKEQQDAPVVIPIS